MPAVCGLACEVCRFPEKGLCPIGRCVPGTDPKAPEKLEKFKAATGHPCFILECAIKKKGFIPLTQHSICAIIVLEVIKHEYSRTPKTVLHPTQVRGLPSPQALAQGCYLPQMRS